MPLSPACMSATFSGSSYISFITDYLHSSLIIYNAFNTNTTCIFDYKSAIAQQELNKKVLQWPLTYLNTFKQASQKNRSHTVSEAV